MHCSAWLRVLAELSTTRGYGRLIVGPISSIFDICIFLTLWYYFRLVTADNAQRFQSGWFIESLLTQVRKCVATAWGMLLA